MITQYFFQRGLFGRQVLWVREQGMRPDADALGYCQKMESYTRERRATASEAALLLPLMNCGLPISAGMQSNACPPGDE